jgi:hypothetical protein
VHFPNQRPAAAQAKLTSVPGKAARLLTPPPKPTPQPKPTIAPPPVVQLRGGGEAFAVPPALNLSGSGGRPLPAAVREKMESFFGTSFADVRVHVGPQAASIGALAFTHGSNLYFAPGQYSPTTAHGQQLLGHELTHVLQQRAGRVRNPFGSRVAVVQDGSLEAEADRLGLQVASHPSRKPPPGHPARSPGSRSAAVQQKRSDTIQPGKAKRRKRARARAAHQALIERERQEEEKRARRRERQEEEYRSLGPVRNRLSLILETDRLNVVGEDHTESKARRRAERVVTGQVTGGGYWTEDEFTVGVGVRSVRADPHTYRFLSSLQHIAARCQILAEARNPLGDVGNNVTLARLTFVGVSPLIALAEGFWASARGVPYPSFDSNQFGFNPLPIGKVRTRDALMAGRYEELRRLKSALTLLSSFPVTPLPVSGFNMTGTAGIALQTLRDAREAMVENLMSIADFDRLRSGAMHEAAQLRSRTRGVWKIGEVHVQHILRDPGFAQRDYNLVTQVDFNNALFGT